MFGRYIFAWKGELYPVGVRAFPFMEALGLRIEAIGSVWVTVFEIVCNDVGICLGYSNMYHDWFRVFRYLLGAGD